MEVLVFGIAWHYHQKSQHLQDSLCDTLEVFGGVFKIITNGGENALKQAVSLTNQSVQQCNLSRHLEKVDLSEIALNCWNSDMSKSDASFHKCHCFLCVLAFNKGVAADAKLQCAIYQGFCDFIQIDEQSSGTCVDIKGFVEIFAVVDSFEDTADDG